MRYIYLMIGMISFGLGFIGIVLPILPTTPFLLLAGFCFARSSKRVHNWFVSTKAYQRHLEPFVQKRAMTLKTKNHYLHSEPTKNLKILILSGF